MFHDEVVHVPVRDLSNDMEEMQSEAIIRSKTSVGGGQNSAVKNRPGSARKVRVASKKRTSEQKPVVSMKDERLAAVARILDKKKSDSGHKPIIGS